MSTKAAFALLAGLTMAAPAAAFADSRPVAAHVEHVNAATAPAPAAAQDVSSYADREAGSKKAQEFQGGQVVIVMSGAALVLLLVLLLVI
jgi:hypothetical protein